MHFGLFKSVDRLICLINITISPPSLIYIHCLFRSSVRVNSLNLWDLQQSLDRGDFIEVKPSVEFKDHAQNKSQLWLRDTSASPQLQPTMVMVMVVSDQLPVSPWELSVLQWGLRERMEDCRITLTDWILYISEFKFSIYIHYICTM